MLKNSCRYCGQKSLTWVPFPMKKMVGRPRAPVCPKCYSLKNIELLEGEEKGNGKLREVMTRQQLGSHKRKMLDNDRISIVLWFDDDNALFGFQLNISNGELHSHSFTWTMERGSHFSFVYNTRRKFLTNTLQPAENFPKKTILKLFSENSLNLRQEYRDLILEKIRKHS